MGIFQTFARLPLKPMYIWSLYPQYSTAAGRALIVCSSHLIQHRCVHSRGLGASQGNPGAAPPRLPFSRVTQEDLAYFRTTLPGRTITDPDLLKSCNVDWLKTVEGKLNLHFLKNSFQVVCMFYLDLSTRLSQFSLKVWVQEYFKTVSLLNIITI